MRLLPLVVLLPAPILAQIRVLFQNDLSANISTPALLIEQPTIGSNASTACALYNEKLLSFVSPDIRDSLNYLIFRGDLTNASRIYVGGPASTHPSAKRWENAFNAYTVGNAMTTPVDGEDPLVCSNTPLCACDLPFELVL